MAADLVERLELAHLGEGSTLGQRWRQQDVRHGLVRGVEGRAHGHKVHVWDGGCGEAAPRTVHVHGDVNVRCAPTPVRAFRSAEGGKLTIILQYQQINRYAIISVCY